MRWRRMIGVRGAVPGAVSINKAETHSPIGAQGTSAIYTDSGGVAALCRVAIRAYSWGNWLYPLQ